MRRAALGILAVNIQYGWGCNAFSSFRTRRSSQGQCSGPLHGGDCLVYVVTTRETTPFLRSGLRWSLSARSTSNQYHLRLSTEEGRVSISVNRINSHKPLPDHLCLQGTVFSSIRVSRTPRSVRIITITSNAASESKFATIGPGMRTWGTLESPSVFPMDRGDPPRYRSHR